MLSHYDAEYRDWSAASVFGDTNGGAKPPSRHFQVSNQERNDDTCMRPTPPARRRFKSVTLSERNAAAIVIQRYTRLSLLRWKAQSALIQVEDVTETLRLIAVTTIQTMFRRFRCRKSSSIIRVWLIRKHKQMKDKQERDFSRRLLVLRRQRGAMRLQSTWRRYSSQQKHCAAIRIQRNIRKWMVCRRAAILRQNRNGALQLIECYYQHKIKTGFNALHHHMEKTRQRITKMSSRRIDRTITKYIHRRRAFRSHAALTIQRIVRGMFDRRRVAEIKRCRFQCSNCGLLEPGGIYCKRCGRPKAKPTRKKVEGSQPSPRSQCLAPVSLTSCRIRPLPQRRQSEKGSKLVQETMLRAKTLDIIDIHGEKAKAMMQQRAQRSSKFLAGGSR